MQTRTTASALASSGIAGLAALVANASLAQASALAAPDVRLAYIDPGSGSFVLQALIAAVAGAAVAVNAYWGKITRLLGIGSSKSKDDATDTESTDD